MDEEISVYYHALIDTFRSLALVYRKINQLQEANLVLRKHLICSATQFRTLCTPPIIDYLFVYSTKRRYSENQYREITTANWGLETSNQII